MRKAILALTALAFMINLAVPALSANAGTTSGKTTVTKHKVKSMKTVCPSIKMTTESKKMHKRMGAGPTKHHKYMKKTSGKTCPRMPGQTY